MYIRDKRSPIPKSETVSRVMSANRAKNTTPEVILRKALRRAGVRGYRLHYRVSIDSGGRRSSVRPDISFVSKKLAIFVNGCYWHRCLKCNYPIPKTNTAFWKAKFDANIARDARRSCELRRLGWHVITVWECEIRRSLTPAVNRILRATK